MDGGILGRCGSVGRIREAILHNDIGTADKLLGYEFFFSGVVVHGDKMGRKLGYPTANLKIIDEEKTKEQNIILEIRAGTGGEEAELFVYDLYQMYSRFANKKK